MPRTQTISTALPQPPLLQAQVLDDEDAWTTEPDALDDDLLAQLAVEPDL